MQEMIIGLGLCLLGLFLNLYCFYEKREVKDKEHLEVQKFITSMMILGIDHTEILKQVAEMDSEELKKANKKLKVSLIKYKL